MWDVNVKINDNLCIKSIIDEALDKITHEVIDKAISKAQEDIYSRKKSNQQFLSSSVLKNSKSLDDYIIYLLSQERIKCISIATILNVIKNPEILEEVYLMFKDEESRKTFRWFIQYRLAYGIIGKMAEKIFPFPSNREEWIENGRKLLSREGSYFKIGRYKIKTTFPAVFNTWIREQYLIENKCEPKVGDIVFDAGAYLGETSIWFADKVGTSGKVYSFEPSLENSVKFKENIKLNKFDKNIFLIDKGLWNKSGEINFAFQESSSFCSKGKGDCKINIIDIDSFVEKEKIPKVDFVKMDIEGGELKALEGAKNVLSKYKPKLAISIYHLPDDIIKIPIYIKSIVPEYQLFLSHKNDMFGETMLFAIIN